MSDISKIDSNFKVDAVLEKDGMKFYDADCAPFNVYGLMREDETYCRLPRAVAEATNGGVAFLCSNTAGGRVRFITDSSRIAIKAEYADIGKMPHFPLTGSAGFDLYERTNDGEKYCKVFVPPYEITESLESSISFDDSQKRLLTINFPLYSTVKKLYIGLEQDAVIEAAPEYSTDTPVVFYGSSITQGGCASRAGISYQGYLSRAMDFDYINLGFSGSAKAETAMAEYIAGLKMSAFVFDYDHNAPDKEWLNNTHYPFYKIIRKAQPNLPILFLSRPTFKTNDSWNEMRFIIEESFNKAKAEGDENVYYISGEELFAGRFRDECTVDGCHPNDIGFLAMATTIEPVLSKMLFVK